ncbi:hypothetical protein HA43_14510 [Pantoea eucrina]|nr:hypothetical protein HA43_14510 [Pantoea eucrina]
MIKKVRGHDFGGTPHNQPCRRQHQRNAQQKSSVASGFCPIAAGAGSQLFISKSAPATAQAPSASSSNTGFGNLAKLRIVIPLLFAGLVRRIAAASIAVRDSVHPSE